MTSPRDFSVVGIWGLFIAAVLALPLDADQPPGQPAAAPAGGQAGDSAGEIKKREPTRFMRVRHDEYKHPVALQTATARYVLKGPSGEPKLEVFLESVIHVGDRSYYRGFNQRFRHYDVVLYEFVAPPEKRVPDPDQGISHPLRLIQQVAADGLGFAHQIDEIDYKAQNLVHSDLSPEELNLASKNRGDDDFTLLVDTLLDTMRRVNRERISPDAEATAEDPPIDLSVLSDPDGAVKIRRLLATGFGTNVSLESVMRPAQIATLIRARNDRAMKVFQEQLDAGKRRIALFWGAGHMEDFERKMILAYGIEPAGVVWRDAWDLREGAVERAPLEAILENSLRGKLKDAVERLLTPPEPDDR